MDMEKAMERSEIRLHPCNASDTGHTISRHRDIRDGGFDPMTTGMEAIWGRTGRRKESHVARWAISHSGWPSTTVAA